LKHLKAVWKRKKKILSFMRSMKDLTIHPTFMKDVDAYVQSRMVDGKISSGDILKAEAFAYNELKNTKNFADENKRKLASDVVRMALGGQRSPTHGVGDPSPSPPVGGQNHPPPMGEDAPSPSPPVVKKPVKRFNLLGWFSCFLGAKSSVSEVVVPEALEVVSEVVSEVVPLVVREVAEVVSEVVSEVAPLVVREVVDVADSVSETVREVVSETVVVAEVLSEAVSVAVVAEAVSEAVAEAVSVAVPEVVPELSSEQATESEERGWRGLA